LLKCTFTEKSKRSTLEIVVTKDEDEQCSCNGSEAKGVGPIAAFEEGTPESAINLAIRKLGQDNVITFPK